ncbi:hypothetical protein GCM10027053_26040 [Intrasporangium mesophilum]
MGQGKGRLFGVEVMQLEVIHDQRGDAEGARSEGLNHACFLDRGQWPDQAPSRAQAPSFGVERPLGDIATHLPTRPNDGRDQKDEGDRHNEDHTYSVETDTPPDGQVTQYQLLDTGHGHEDPESR